MRTGTPGFVASRLIEAREGRRIVTRESVAKLINMSPSTVQRWEEGASTPEPEALYKLARALDVRPEFFVRPSIKEDRPVFFRSLATTLKRDKSYQRARIVWLQEVSHVLQHYVELPAVDLPDLLGNKHFTELTNDDLEEFAMALRRHWNLGDGPCPDVVGVMEHAGFVVGSEKMHTPRLDGLCKWCESEQRPYVLLAEDKMSYARRQLDAAHEMAHAILHRRVTADELEAYFKLIEDQAFRLGSAFLMPRATYGKEARVATLNSLLVLKERWKVSVKAQIKRMRELSLIDDEDARFLYKQYSARGWTQGEPYDDVWPLQPPRALNEAINAIVNAKIRSKGDLLRSEFTFPARDVEELCNLPAGWFGAEQSSIVRLIPRASSESADGAGELFPFKRAEE
jgi:Zn-dependent peptidase ImmA (M78 family)/transcriptional regulator with XRE-family HTH domain